jgi:Domain of unknown function (DUF4326)
MSVVHCKREAYDVYIGRGRDPRTGEPGRWGNQFSHQPSRVAGITLVATREEAIESYRRWLWEEIEAERVDLAVLSSLHGKALGCWCAPEPCHGEVLEAAAFWALGEQARRVARRATTLAREHHAG